MIPLRDNVLLSRMPVAVYALIAVNAAVFLYELCLPADDTVLLVYEYGLVPQRYTDPAWAVLNGLPPGNHWPFLTSTFLHGGWLHIAFNMWTLYLFGSTLEARLGAVQFLVFYLCCAVGSTAVHAYFNADSTMPVIGASGAIAGVIGAYAATFPRARITLLVPIVFIPLIFSIPAIAFATVWFGIQLLQGTTDVFSSTLGDHIAWWSHIGGFVTGIILLPVFLLLAPARSTQFRWERDPWDNTGAP